MPVTFREAIEAGYEEDGYEPQILWLIPVHLRSRIRYYEEALERIEGEIADLWNRVGYKYGDREQFSQSGVVNHIWDHYSPLWWGLNDIIGYIDVRACGRVMEIQASLFLTTKRASRRLKDKAFVHCRREIVPFEAGQTNSDLQRATIRAVETLAGDDRLKRRYLDLEPWRRLVNHTDIIGIVREAVAEDEAY